MPDFDPPPVPPDGQAVTILVAWYDPDADPEADPPESRYELAPNIRCERIEFLEGANPPTAQFSYILDDTNPASPFPAYAEQLWPLGIDGKRRNELVVIAVEPGDDADATTILFHGYADAPQLDMAGSQQQVTFTATGVTVTAWDTVIRGAIVRSSEDPEAGDDVDTELPCRFNPRGQPNATPSGFDVDEGGEQPYPVFLDHRIQREPDPRRLWTLGMFARYLLFTNLPRFLFDLTLDESLQALEPIDDQPINTLDPATYTLEDIIVDDVDATGRPWLEVLADVLGRHGFAIRIAQKQRPPVDDEWPEPSEALQIYRRDSLRRPAPKSLLLQAGGPFDRARTNLGALGLVRDEKQAASSITVATRLVLHEISVVLAPGFEIDPDDATTPDAFSLAALATATAAQRDKYRLYVADEAGDGHWNFADAEWVTNASLNLDDVLGGPDEETGEFPYVARPRPALDELLTRDTVGRRKEPTVAISVNYGGEYPAVWDGTGTWQEIGRSRWRLLDDRLGVRLTVDNPNKWEMPEAPAGGVSVIPGNVVRGVESQAAPDGQKPRFWLRLTCVIEADIGIFANAPKRVGSPMIRDVERRIDGTDLFRAEIRHESSIHATDGTEILRDDTDAAVALATTLRDQRDNPVIAGRAVIPRISIAYHVGDRVKRIVGRDIDLRVNAASEAGETPRYPNIAGLFYDFSNGRQATHLVLRDERTN